MWSVLTVLACFLPVQLPATRPAPYSAETRPTLAQIGSVLSQLGSPRYNVREQATDELCRLRNTDLPLLIDRYLKEEKYEPKRRLRFIIEYIFYRDEVTGRNGFMGIQLYGMSLSDIVDPVSGRTTRGSIVQHVMPGFAGQRAGVHDLDIIIALDGQVLPDDPTTRAFVDRVGSHRPGTTINLRILRPGETRKVRLTAGPQPASLLAGAHWAISPSGMAAAPTILFVSSVDEKTPAAVAGLKSNELLRSVNGKSLSGYGVSPVEGLLSNIPPNSEVTLELVSTKATSIDVRLEARPPEFIKLEDIAKGREAFMRWWEDQGGDPPARPIVESAPRAVWGIPPLRTGPEITLLP